MRVSTVLATILTLVIIAAKSTLAVQLADGTVYFAEPPTLITARTTFKAVNAWDATYYFTLDIPENAGEPLQRVEITQKNGTQQIRFDLKRTTAFVGTEGNKQQPLSLLGVTRDKNTSTISITFDPPVSPGRTITIGLHPDQNPEFSGVYLFGVTAFPAGEKSHGQFLGYGRLQFYDEGGGPFGFPFGLP
ncbi:MAG: DUF2808 domain-containing protein [Chroococcidiopsidaceae cyanobacterium CP_BM_ER_R8_30]|nr:DUF2808 domain-containing protein [Chroococcidiopsidaceae cyanobacterium CP_BM_ER_R8_30]